MYTEGGCEIVICLTVLSIHALRNVQMSLAVY